MRVEVTLYDKRAMQLQSVSFWITIVFRDVAHQTVEKSDIWCKSLIVFHTC